MRLRIFFALLTSLVISQVWSSDPVKVMHNEWVATRINGERINGKPPTLTIEQDRAFGTGGCNRYSGKVLLDEKDSIRFGSVASTRVACPDNAMQQEVAYFGALQSVTGYHLNQGNLILLDKDFNKLVEFDSMID